MNSNDFFVVKKSSKLYKFYNTLAEIPGYNLVTPATYNKRHDKETQIFRDICTFIRVNIYYLLVTPFILAVLALVLGLFVASPLLVIIDQFYTLNLYSDVFEMGLALLFMYCMFSIVFMVIKWFIELKTYIESKQDDNIEDDKPSNIFIQAIKDKHNQICRQIKVEDD